MSSQPTVEVAGSVTVDSCPHLRSVLLRLPHAGSDPVMTIDLSKVTYMNISMFSPNAQSRRESSTFIRDLSSGVIRHRKRCRSRAGTFQVS
jgi:hypothetical protein